MDEKRKPLGFGFYNMDCMEGMRCFPDKYFDLAIVDPPYGGVTQGGYMTNQMGGGVAKNRNDYHLSLWQCEKPSKTYFNELFRISKNQIIWGVTITQPYCLIVNVGLYGIKKSLKALALQMLNSHGLLLILPQE